MTAAAPSKTQRVLRKSALYQHPIGVVWAALTDGEALAQWLMPNDFAPEEGREFQFRVDPMLSFTGLVQCRVLELDPPRRMVWSWVSTARPGKRQPPPMRLEWTLAEEAGGARLTLTQTGLEGQPFLYNIMMSMGWGTMLKRWLPRVLDAFQRSGESPDLWVYRRLEKAPNRGHHKTRTIPATFHK
ncbi:MAG: SRPBCC domain-containing protein [Phycisphaerales bacterium]